MSRPRLPRHLTGHSTGHSTGQRRARRAAVGVLAAAALAAGTLAATPAQSAPDASCPAPFPVADLIADQTVHGLTVVQGTVPSTFTGTYLGTLKDGIAPGLDMILVRLTSAELTRVGGIWAGMSGSPVYAADGRLIGAVSYGLATGPSTIAGVTPAEEMESMLSTSPAAPAGRVQVNRSVAVPPRIAQRAVSLGAVAAAAADGMRMTPAPLSLGVSGLSAQRLDKVAPRLHMAALKAYRATSSSSAAPADIPIVAGGNLAASVAYGDVNATGVGTATAVCGDEVLAFGHPMNFTGPSTMTLHGADAIVVQEDPTVAGFKVANVGSPNGTVTEDRMAGLHALLGAPPKAAEITSTVTLGARGRDGVTRSSVPAAVPDVALMHFLSNQDRVFDGINQGTDAVRWTVEGTRGDGSPFSYTRGDLFASRTDATFDPALALASELWTLQFQDLEDIAFTKIAIRSDLSRDYNAVTVTKLEEKIAGAWYPVDPNGLMRVRAGHIKRLRITLTSFQNRLGTHTYVVRVPVPPRAAGKDGMLEVFGGNSGGGGEFFGPEGDGSGTTVTSWDQLLRSVVTAPRHDDVVAKLSLFRFDGSVLERQRRFRAPAVASGGLTVAVHGTR